jgi:hypothetical protein
VTPRTIHRLEIGGVVHVAEKKRHGHLSRAIWTKIVEALALKGVELIPEAETIGAGVRWKQPRGMRSAPSPAKT